MHNWIKKSPFQNFDADDVKYALEVVTQRSKTEIAATSLQAAHQKMIHSDPMLKGAERMPPYTSKNMDMHRILRSEDES